MHRSSNNTDVAGCKSEGFGADVGPALSSAPEGDELAALDAETLAALIGLYDAAETEDDLMSFREELEYSNALIGFDETVQLGASIEDVQMAFDQLMHAALGNRFGQDVIRETTDILHASHWQLDEANLQTIVKRPTPPEGSQRPESKLAGVDG